MSCCRICVDFGDVAERLQLYKSLTRPSPHPVHDRVTVAILVTFARKVLTMSSTVLADPDIGGLSKHNMASLRSLQIRG